MQLYRLDSHSGPVADLLGPRLFRTRTTARSAGLTAAADRREDITLTTITNHGSLRPDLLIVPTGRCKRLTY